MSELEIAGSLNFEGGGEEEEAKVEGAELERCENIYYWIYYWFGKSWKGAKTQVNPPSRKDISDCSLIVLSIGLQWLLLGEVEKVKKMHIFQLTSDFSLV